MSLANGASGIVRGFEAEADLRPKAGMLRSHLLLQDFAHVEISDASDKTSMAVPSQGTKQLCMFVA